MKLNFSTPQLYTFVQNGCTLSSEYSIKILIANFYKLNVSNFGRDNDISQGTLSNIIGSRNSNPSYEIIVKILSNKELNINPKWFILGTGEISNNDIEDEISLQNIEKTTHSFNSH